ncbi:MAG: branched-chain-amino-acid transaminase [Actinomycetota bacterium]
MTVTSDAADVTGGEPAPAKFGTVFGERMAVAGYSSGGWEPMAVVDTDSVSFGPATHALHYASACFEGLKAHRQPDGTVASFRADRHVERMRQSADRLCLPVPPAPLLSEMIAATVEANAAITPAPPGSLYLRPTLLGTDHDIGAAATPSATAILYVLASPVGEYLPPRALRILVETSGARTTPQFGVVKTGANYAMALGVIRAARTEHDADQVLFAPGGVIEETGASNIVFLDGRRIVTPALTDAFLHGVTRDSLLRLATDRGWEVEEREVTVEEIAELIARPTAEVALSGTAAVLASVGELVIDGEVRSVGTPGSTPRTDELRQALTDIQTGRTTVGWA